MARELLTKANSNGMPFLYVVGDSWFFSREITELADSLGKVWIFESKKDRVVRPRDGFTFRNGQRPSLRRSSSRSP
jgi:hypothetical protein